MTDTEEPSLADIADGLVEHLYTLIAELRRTAARGGSANPAAIMVVVAHLESLADEVDAKRRKLQTADAVTKD